MAESPPIDPRAVYRADWKDRSILYSALGCHAPRWLVESFTLEGAIKDWWDVKEYDFVLDIGAGFGSYTLLALAAGATRVVSIEPAKEEFWSLCQNVWLNQLDGSFIQRFTPLPLVMGDVDDMAVPFSFNTHSCITIHEQDSELRLCLTVDTLISRLGIYRVDWVKIDVEGAELMVLRGMKTTLLNHRPRVLVEYHRGINPTIAVEVDEYMQGQGYRVARELQGSGLNEEWKLWEPC